MIQWPVVSAQEPTLMKLMRHGHGSVYEPSSLSPGLSPYPQAMTPSNHDTQNQRSSVSDTMPLPVFEIKLDVLGPFLNINNILISVRK